VLSQDPQENLVVIPANPGSQFEAARPGIQELKDFWMPVFTGMTVKVTHTSPTIF
jgi:hypothetical protein